MVRSVELDVDIGADAIDYKYASQPIWARLSLTF